MPDLAANPRRTNQRVGVRRRSWPTFGPVLAVLAAMLLTTAAAPAPAEAQDKKTTAKDKAKAASKQA